MTQLATFAAIAIARGLALLLPFRTRPLATPGLGYHVIDPSWNTDIHQWSSFPSDHAVLFFALATGITLLNCRMGIVMFLYAAIVDCLPRAYLGLHYPSDLAAGALLGSAPILIAAKPQIRRPIAERILSCFERSPGLAYAVAFLCSFGLATMFDSVENLAKAGIRVMLATARGTPFVHAPLHLSLGQSAIGDIASAIVSALLLVGAGVAVMRRASRSPSRARPSNERADVPAEWPLARSRSQSRHHRSKEGGNAARRGRRAADGPERVSAVGMRARRFSAASDIGPALHRTRGYSVEGVLLRAPTGRGA